jgi:hypothetical protein
MMNPFLHSEMDFKEQKIVISCRFMLSDFGEKSHFIEQLDNALKRARRGISNGHCKPYTKTWNTKKMKAYSFLHTWEYGYGRLE